MGVRILVSAMSIVLLQSQGLATPAGLTLSYTPLSDAARASGQLDHYADCRTYSGDVTLGEHVLRFAAPRRARAYDVVPIRYTLERPAGPRRAVAEAVAFEEPKKAADRALYDLAIPGHPAVRIDYLGSVCADWDMAKVTRFTTDAKQSPACTFPPFRRDPMVCSGTIREANFVLFRLRVTNVGDTILDSEGFGATFGQASIHKLDEEGKDEWNAGTVNVIDRQLDYLYPGDSYELWVNFTCPRFQGGASPETYKWVTGLREGRYRVAYEVANSTSRQVYGRLEVSISVTRDGGDTPVQSTFTPAVPSKEMPQYLDAFEEFMTSLRVHDGGEQAGRQDGIIYLQVAPWTKHVVVKLVLTDPREIAVARVPIRVTQETLAVKRNPRNPMVMEKDGREEPVIAAMLLPAFRIGIQQGPYPEKVLRDSLAELKSLGVNVIDDTCTPYYAPEPGDPEYLEIHSATYKHFFDVLMRKHGMKSFGFSLYMPTAPGFFRWAAPLLGGEPRTSTTWTTDPSNPAEFVDFADPSVAKVVAAWARYAHTRWGDLWFRTRDGRVPVSMEDGRGSMRDDINWRLPEGQLSYARFRAWVRRKYSTIGMVNNAWGSAFASFDQIDPEADGRDASGAVTPLGIQSTFNRRDRVFHDWSPAMADWDAFRTELRLELVRKVRRILAREIPGAEVSIRTETGGIPIRQGPEWDGPHMRHAYYASRRQALDPEVLNRERALRFYEEYATIPYTEEEWRHGMREMVANGITPMFLPNFANMYDVVLNPYYGRDYQIDYNLDKPAKGLVVRCLTAAFPWWKAAYEEGGAPNIIWSDYTVGGYATATQKRELKLLRRQFGRME